MDVKAVLTEARKLIENPKNWIRNSLVRDKDNKPTALMSNRAHKFCLIGCVKRASYDNSGEGYFEISNAACDELEKGLCKYETLWAFNDASSHDQVLKLIDNTIERLSK